MINPGHLTMFYTGHLAFVAKCNLSQFASNRNNTVRMWVKRQQYTSIIILVVYLSLQIMLCCVHLKRYCCVLQCCTCIRFNCTSKLDVLRIFKLYHYTSCKTRSARVQQSEQPFYTIMHVFQLFFELSNQDAVSFFVSMTSEFVITEKCITT